MALGGNNATNYTRVGINNNNPLQMLHIKQYAAYDGMAIENDANTNTWGYNIGFADLNLKFNGTIIGFWDDVTGNYTALSDKKFKKNINYLKNGYLEKVLLLKPTFYQLLHANENSKPNIGFIAQEVQTILPETVRETEDGNLSINYDDFGIISIKAIQEQQLQIDELKKENKLLREQIDEIKKMLNK